MVIVVWNFSRASQLFLLVSDGQSLVCLVGSEHSEGLSESRVKPEQSPFLKEERSMFSLPSTRRGIVFRKDAADSDILTKNSSQSSLGDSGFWAATHICHHAVAICKQHRASWFVSSNPRCTSLDCSQSVHPLKCLPISMPLLYADGMKSQADLRGSRCFQSED